MHCSNTEIGNTLKCNKKSTNKPHIYFVVAREMRPFLEQKIGMWMELECELECFVVARETSINDDLKSAMWK